MKIILSRKGFDSSYGGYPSPILPDGRMISLPIPSRDNIKYSDLEFEQGKTYAQLMIELGIKESISKNTCHLDPDIYPNVIRRYAEWTPIFGQANSAQGHLKNQNIKKNDLFLFFGTFQKTIYSDGKLSYDKTDKPKHIIFGYLQISRIVNSTFEIEDWMKYHSHCKSQRNWKDNAVYVARNTTSWNPKLSGAGTFKYGLHLVLTAKDQLKSIWDIPILKSKKISYHNKNSWKNGFLKSAGRGQEFVIQEDQYVKKWARELIEKSILLS